MGKILKFQAQEQTTFAPREEEPQKFKTWGESFEAASDERKLRMIWTVAWLETINSYTKADLHKMLRWLAQQTIEEE